MITSFIYLDCYSCTAITYVCTCRDVNHTRFLKEYLFIKLPLTTTASYSSSLHIETHCLMYKNSVMFVYILFLFVGFSK